MQVSHKSQIARASGFMDRSESVLRDKADVCAGLMQRGDNLHLTAYAGQSKRRMRPLSS